ncbi:MAG: hypothetical protein AAFR68_04070 [Pseudomonadota bacterium]
MSEQAEPIVARILPMKTGKVTQPTAIFDGPEPEAGSSFRFIGSDNGVIYTGIVAETAVIDGETVVQFEHGIRPVTE